MKLFLKQIFYLSILARISLCEYCQDEYYGDGVNSTACPDNYTSTIGSNISLDCCTTCPSNFYSTNGSGCIKCPNNQYSETGQSCQNCTDRYYSVGGTDCSKCAEGMTSIGGSSCVAYQNILVSLIVSLYFIFLLY